MPTIAGILAFMGRIDLMLGCVELEKVVQHLDHVL